MKVRKKPVVVEAFQMTKEHRWDNSEWPEWLHRAWNTTGEGSLYCVNSGKDLFIGTKEGTIGCPIDSWIIEGVNGEIYPCDPVIFEKTYEIEFTGKNSHG